MSEELRKEQAPRSTRPPRLAAAGGGRQAAVVRRAFTTPILFSVLAVFLCGGGCGDTPEGSGNKGTGKSNVLRETAERGPVRLTVTVTPKEPTYADLIKVQIEVSSEPETEVGPPDFGPAAGGFAFKVRDYLEKPPRLENGHLVRRYFYKLEPELTGEVVVPTVTVRFTDRRAGSESRGKKLSVSSKPLTLKITAPTGKQTPTLDDLRPAAAPLPLPDDYRRRRWVSVVFIVILGVGMFLFYRRWKRRKSPELPPVPPEEWARKELEALLREDLVGKGAIKEFYVRLTGIVRRYIEKTTGLRAPEQTTEEFLRALQGAAKDLLPKERAAALGGFLEAADLVKYAGAHPEATQIEAAFIRAKEFVGLGQET